MLASCSEHGTIYVAGANVQKGHFLDTPLHAAAQKDCPEIVKVLLEFGADINARNLDLQRAVETAPASSLAECMLLQYEGKHFLHSSAQGMGTLQPFKDMNTM